MNNTRQLIVALWTAPRCCGTAFELMVESRGDFRIEVNVFDHVFYFLDRQGNDPPSENDPQKPDSFKETYEQLMMRARRDGGTFIRNAAYTVMNHLNEASWADFRHCFVIRDPRYVLPSHRKLVPNITREEAGFEAQLQLFRYFSRHCDARPIVIDAHELLSHPREIVGAWCKALNIPFVERSLRWPAGFRPRWGMWPRWKEDAARSTGFSPFKPNPETERAGVADPLFESCWRCYQEMREHRIRFVPQSLQASIPQPA